MQEKKDAMFSYQFPDGDRRLAFSRQSSFRHWDPSPPLPSPSPSPSSNPNPLLPRSHSFKPFLARSDSAVGMPLLDKSGQKDATWIALMLAAVRGVANGSRPMKRLALMISLNVAYSMIELLLGLFTGRVGLVSDAFHLTFGCGILTFSLFAMGISRKKPDQTYTYGYKRLEVLAAFTNALFLLFLSFSLAVEALHAFMQDESEHKHYLIVSAVTNLLVNLLGVWFFRSYARVNIVYWKPEDMNYHSVCLHVLADSIRSAGLILASWFLTLGVENAEVLCLGIVSVAVFMLVLPLFKATGSILLQIAPSNIHPSAFNKCSRQIASLEEVLEVSQARFWELVPGYSIGSFSVQVKKGVHEDRILQHVNGLYNDLGIQDLTVQIDYK